MTSIPHSDLIDGMLRARDYWTSQLKAGILYKVALLNHARERSKNSL